VKVYFGLPGMAWNGESHFWLDWNGLEWWKSFLSRLEWLGMERVGFGLTGMAWNGRRWFWLDYNVLEW
jgi:hypothetical protein